jgi:hypothetical protein
MGAVASAAITVNGGPRERRLSDQRRKDVGKPSVGVSSSV